MPGYPTGGPWPAGPWRATRLLGIIGPIAGVIRDMRCEGDSEDGVNTCPWKTKKLETLTGQNGYSVQRICHDREGRSKKGPCDRWHRKIWSIVFNFMSFWCWQQRSVSGDCYWGREIMFRKENSSISLKEAEVTPMSLCYVKYFGKV